MKQGKRFTGCLQTNKPRTRKTGPEIDLDQTSSSAVGWKFSTGATIAARADPMENKDPRTRLNAMLAA